jgi:hypothetical protein
MTWEACYATPVDAEAHVVKGFLEHHGIPCMLDSGRFAAQPLTFCALGEVRVLVPLDFVQVARGLISGRADRPRRPRRRPAAGRPTLELVRRRKDG